MRRVSSLCLYRVAFVAIASIPLGYFVFALPDIGIQDGPMSIQWWIKFRPGSLMLWLLFGGTLGALWHLIASARNSN